MRKVKEQRMRFVVTHRGHPIAAIIPIEETRASSQAEASAWDELVELGQQIGQGWQSSQSSAEILSDMRR
jgi:antitoxin (DNA-binding transcriptional repressor) of toxin-antitoxin stability system